MVAKLIRFPRKNHYQVLFPTYILLEGTVGKVRHLLSKYLEYFCALLF